MTQLERVLLQALTLSPMEKIQLIERVAATLKEDISQNKPTLYGVWAGIDVSDSDIEEARREMTRNFPREDFL